MKKRTKKNILVVLSVIVIISVLGIVYIRKTGKLAGSTVFSEIRNSKNSEVIEEVGFLHTKVHLMLKIEDVEDLNNGLSFEVVNPKGDIVDKGILKENEVYRKTYESKKGEWKIKFNFPNEKSEAMVSVGFKNNSTKENNMKIE
ncbi:MAG: hypothetical protein ACRC30_05435 [Clostridium sp.]